MWNYYAIRILFKLNSFEFKITICSEDLVTKCSLEIFFNKNFFIFFKRINISLTILFLIRLIVDAGYAKNVHLWEVVVTFYTIKQNVCLFTAIDRGAWRHLPNVGGGRGALDRWFGRKCAHICASGLSFNPFLFTRCTLMRTTALLFITRLVRMINTQDTWRRPKPLGTDPSKTQV